MNSDQQLILQALSSLTAVRESFDFETSVCVILARALRTQCIELWRMQDGQQLALLGSMVGDQAVEAVDVNGLPKQLYALDRNPVWAECLRSGVWQGRTDEQGWFGAFPLRINGRPLGLLQLGFDLAPSTQQCELLRLISEVLSNHLSLLDYAERDALTHLLNRKTFENQFKRLAWLAPCDDECAGKRQSQSHAQPWLGVIDIDHFKRINDVHGHQRGDEVLCWLAKQLQLNFRAHDRIYRFGGEEFVVVLTPALPDNAYSAFERLRARIAAHSYPDLGAVTISLGFCPISREHGAAATVARADEALYQAKHNGRNRVIGILTLPPVSSEPAPAEGDAVLF